MENITVGQIAVGLVFILGLWASIETITKKVGKAFDSSLDKKLKPINDKFDQFNKKMDSIDMQATKNYLVSCLDDIQKGDISEIGKERFYEEFRHYTEDLKGNSYIKARVEKLRKEGLL